MSPSWADIDMLRPHDALENHSCGDMVEICYFESGDQEYVVENRTYRLTGGDMFVTAF